MNILVLDDDTSRYPFFRNLSKKGHEVKICSDIESCKKILLEKKTYDIFFIDHNLELNKTCRSESTESGAEICRWLVHNRKQCSQIHFAIAHTVNFSGAINISSILDSIDLSCYEISYDDLQNSIEDYILLFQKILDT